MNRRQQRQRRGEGGHVRPWEFSISAACRCPFPFSVPSVASCLIPSPLPNANGPPPGNIPLRRALLDTGPRWPSGSSDTTSRLLPVYHMRRLISRGKLSSFVHMAVKTTQHRQPACLAHSPDSLTHCRVGQASRFPGGPSVARARLLPAGAVEFHGGAACAGPPGTRDLVPPYELASTFSGRACPPLIIPAVRACYSGVVNGGQARPLNGAGLRDAMRGDKPRGSCTNGVRPWCTMAVRPPAPR